MTDTNIQLPYFDGLLEKFSQGDPDVIKAFGRHVHWGYWENPARADGSVSDYARAAEELCRRVGDAGKARDRIRLLDVGCGFGGTIASLNERFSSIELVGLNIDRRQLERARREVQAQPDNSIEFIEGNACQLPFPDDSFDVVLAVECIFHFPSRLEFFREARRVLRPGGYLGLSDLIPTKEMQPFLQFMWLFMGSSVLRTYGKCDTNFTLEEYRALAEKTGFSVCEVEDVTLNTVPTYRVLQQLIDKSIFVGWEMSQVTNGLELLSRLQLMQYLILGFQAN
jgi:ubiquinone/menaquinone biosynthesis C-methylase UbiE